MSSVLLELDIALRDATNPAPVSGAGSAPHQRLLRALAAMSLEARVELAGLLVEARDAAEALRVAPMYTDALHDCYRLAYGSGALR